MDVRVENKGAKRRKGQKEKGLEDVGGRGGVLPIENDFRLRSIL